MILPVRKYYVHIAANVNISACDPVYISTSVPVFQNIRRHVTKDRNFYTVTCKENNMQIKMNDNGCIQGQSYLTNIADQNLTIEAHHITSTKNHRILHGIDTCSNYEMRVSTEIAKAMHRTACWNQPT